MNDLIPCEPLVFLKNPHLHTIIADRLPSPSLKVESKKLVVDVSENDQVLVEFYEGTSPVVITLCHGLSGDSRSGYMQRMAIHFLRLGHSVALMNHRNCGLGIGLAKKPYHSGRGDDLGAVIAKLRSLYPQKIQGAVGFSMSGNLLLRLLTVESYQSKPDFAICVNPAINLQRSVSNFDYGLNRLYEAYFIHNFRGILQKKVKAGVLEQKYSVPPWMKIKNFDDMFTAPRSNYESGLSYYKDCSTLYELHKVKVPTFIFTAKDDPFIDYQDFKDAQISPSTILHIEKYGGHMGYLNKSKTPLGTVRWMDYAIVEATQKFISNI